MTASPAAAEDPRQYRVVTIRVDSRAADEVAGIAVGCGALGCAVDEIRIGPDVALHSYFEANARDAERLFLKMVTTGGMKRGKRAPMRLMISDPGWAVTWMDRFRPLAVGKRLLIVAPWHRVSEPKRHRIVIRPGQAFGTGHHASTRGVLLAIETECAKRKFASALDIGTGSGVLAMAMRLLGAREVVGLDSDPIAIVEARKNAEFSGINHLRFTSASLSSQRGRFDLVTANIFSSTLIEMANNLARLVRSGGKLILSGILRREADEVCAAYAMAFALTNRITIRGWSTVVLEKTRR